MKNLIIGIIIGISLIFLTSATVHNIMVVKPARPISVIVIQKKTDEMRPYIISKYKEGFIVKDITKVWENSYSSKFIIVMEKY